MRLWLHEDEIVQQRRVAAGAPPELVRSATRPRISSPVVTDPPPMIMGPLIMAASAAPAARTTPSGRLAIPDLSWTAARFGLVPVRDGWLDNGTGVYLTANEYLAPYELAHGHDFDPSAWADVLLRLNPGEVYIQVLAALNRAARFRDPVFEYQERFLRRLGPGLRIAVASVLAGGADGRPRWFLARQPTLRAMRMVLAGPTAEEPDPRIAALLAGIDTETAAMMLVHLAADALHHQQPEDEARFGSTSESLAIEMICNQIFNEPHDVGGMMSRTWALWTRRAASLERATLDKTALDLLKDATGLELAELLALGFACWAITAHDRVSGPVRINPFTLVKLPRETVERFLALFATTAEELASDLAACALPWQMLPLQTRPLLRISDEVVVLDEPFLLEAVTTGLYWRVSDHVRKDDPEAWKPWSIAYAEMVEALAEELIEALAPVLLDGSSAFFTEEDIKTAFATRKETPPNIDAGVDFGMGVTLFEIVNKHMSLQARSGDLAAFKTDVDQAVITKAGQLDGTAALLRRDPQPPASPLNKPADTVYPIVVSGNHFPVNPITRNYVEEILRGKSKLQGPGTRPLAVLDLDELESCVSLAKAGVLLPDLLAGWLADASYRKGSLTLYLWATYGGIQLERPARVATSLSEAMNAILPLLDIRQDGDDHD
jgi:hypothetical protein